MRCVLCAAAFLAAFSAASAAWAERITIEAASATYWTATDELEIRVWFDSPLVAPPDFIQFGGGRRGDDGTIEGFCFRSDGLVGRDIMEPFYVGYDRHYATGQEIERAAMGLPDIDIRGRTLTAIMPFEMSGLAAPDFNFTATVIRDSKSHVLEGSSSIDRRIVYTPEPSSVTLASFGGVLLVAHLVRTPRLRQRRGKRH